MIFTYTIYRLLTSSLSCWYIDAENARKEFENVNREKDDLLSKLA